VKIGFASPVPIFPVSDLGASALQHPPSRVPARRVRGQVLSGAGHAADGVSAVLSGRETP
jgi:hypothetical protein